MVANYGWSINLIGCARNIIVAPHADQQYYGAPGAYRDDGTSNVFEHVYSEAGVKLLLDTNSVYCTVSWSLYGQPAIQDLTVGKTATITDKDGSVRRSYLKSADGTNQYTTQAGEWAAGALSLSDASGMVYVYYPPALGNVWYFNTDLRPYTDSVRDLGGATQRWRNGFFSSWVRDGTTTKPARPSAATAGPGAHMFDTTLNKPIWSDGAVWRDAAGTAV